MFFFFNEKFRFVIQIKVLYLQRKEAGKGALRLFLAMNYVITNNKLTS